MIFPHITSILVGFSTDVPAIFHPVPPWFGSPCNDNPRRARGVPPPRPSRGIAAGLPWAPRRRHRRRRRGGASSAVEDATENGDFHGKKLGKHGDNIWFHGDLGDEIGGDVVGNDI